MQAPQKLSSFLTILTILKIWSLRYGATSSSDVFPLPRVGGGQSARSVISPPSQSSPSLFSDQCPAAECGVSPLRSHYHQRQQRPCSGEQVTSIISSVPSVECSPAPAHNVSTSQPSPGQRNCYNCEPRSLVSYIVHPAVILQLYLKWNNCPTFETREDLAPPHTDTIVKIHLFCPDHADTGPKMYITDLRDEDIEISVKVRCDD